MRSKDMSYLEYIQKKNYGNSGGEGDTPNNGGATSFFKRIKALIKTLVKFFEFSFD